MSRKARSARGEIVDFDMLAIKQQMSAIPVPVSVNQRRKFVDDRDGFKVKTVKQQSSDVSALQVAVESANISASSGVKRSNLKKAKES
jgi:hypothetical protein